MRVVPMFDEIIGGAKVAAGTPITVTLANAEALAALTAMLRAYEVPDAATGGSPNVQLSVIDERARRPFRGISLSNGVVAAAAPADTPLAQIVANIGGDIQLTGNAGGKVKLVGRYLVATGTPIAQGETLEVTAIIDGVTRNFTLAGTRATYVAPTPPPTPGGPYAHFLILRSQSNGPGRGQFNSAIDTNQANIKQFCDIPSRTSTYRTIRDNVFPLYNPEDRISENFLSPVNYAAKELAAKIPAGDIVLIVPCGWGGTSLLNPAANSAPNAPQWGVGRSLHENMIAQVLAARTAAIAAGYTPVIKAFIDALGEGDNGAVTRTDFTNANVAAYTDARTRIPGAANALVVFQGSLPERLATLPALVEIDEARKDTATALGNAVFVRGASGYQLDDGFNVHYNAAGARVNGRNLGAAITGVAVPTTVTFLSNVTRAEGNSGTTAFTFEARRSSYDGDVAVPVIHGAGTTSTDDYPGNAFPTGLILNFLNNSDAATVTVTTSGDTTVEQNEVFTVTVAPNSPYIAGVTPTVSGNISNDDGSGAAYVRASMDAPDGTGLGSYTSESGHTFTGGGSGFVINGSEFYSTSSGVQFWRLNWTPPSKAYRVYGQFNVKSNTASQGIRWRGVDDNNFYWLANANGTSNLALYATIAGSVSSLGTVTQPPGGTAIGSMPNFDISHDADDVLTVKIDGFTIFGPVVENRLTAAGFVGGRQSASLSASSGWHIMSINTDPIS